MKKLFTLTILALLVASCGVKNNPNIPEGARYPINYPAR